MKTLLLFASILALTWGSPSVWAQKGKDDGSRFGHGEDSVRCVTNLSLYRENVKSKNYDMAIGYWRIVFDECPKASKNIYLDGAKMYQDLCDKNIDQPKKGELVDTLMLIYERRIQYYGEIGNVRGRQGADLLKYRRNDDIQYVQQGYDYLKESVNLEKENSSKAVLPTMLSASISLYKANKVDAKQVIDDYLLISKIVDTQIAASPFETDLKDLKGTIDLNFAKEGPGDCNTLIGIFTEEHKTKREDADFLSMLTNLLKGRGCTDSDLFMVASKDLYKLKPSAEAALNIALLSQNKEQYQVAINYYNEAISLETDNTKKGDYYFNLAIVYSKSKQYSNARQAALSSAELKPGFGEPYILIGQLYAESRELCTSSDATNIPSAVFWVAVDMFYKAKSVDATVAERADKLIGTYSNYFPNKEEAFFKGVNEGDTYQIKDCWINESTRARFN